MRRYEFYSRVVKIIFASESRPPCNCYINTSVLLNKQKGAQKQSKAGKLGCDVIDRLTCDLGTQIWVRINFTSDSHPSITRRSI